jgi:hypothetical protein
MRVEGMLQKGPRKKPYAPALKITDREIAQDEWTSKTEWQRITYGANSRVRDWVFVATPIPHCSNYLHSAAARSDSYLRCSRVWD